MFVGSYQKMSARVRENIQNDEIELPSVEDEVSFIIFPGMTETEDTAIRILNVRDVLVSPGSP